MPQLFDISVKIENEKQVSRAFLTFGEDIKDFKQPLKKSRDLMLKELQKQHSTQGRAFGEPWDPLSPGYAKWKQSRFPGKKILERTGKMRRNYKSKLSTTETEIFNPTSYFKYHQSGKPRTSNLPRRIIMKIDQTRGRKIVGFFSKFIDKTLRKNFKS